MKFQYNMQSLPRRSFLWGGAGLAGAYLVASPLQGLALQAPPAGGREPLERFMRLSGLLVNHALDEQVGSRIHAFAAQNHEQLQARVSELIAIAEHKQARIVEDFFDDIPEGPARELALWIIFAWYTGGSSAKPDSKVFTFEKALTYQTTADVVAIPSYGLSGPNLWSQVTVSLSPLPQF